MGSSYENIIGYSSRNSVSCHFRGGIKIDNRENLGQCPNRGAKKTEMSQFQFGKFENRAGVLYFSKMSEIQKGPKGQRGRDQP